MCIVHGAVGAKYFCHIVSKKLDFRVKFQTLITYSYGDTNDKRLFIIFNNETVIECTDDHTVLSNVHIIYILK